MLTDWLDVIRQNTPDAPIEWISVRVARMHKELRVLTPAASLAAVDLQTEHWIGVTWMMAVVDNAERVEIEQSGVGNVRRTLKPGSGLAWSAMGRQHRPTMDLDHHSCAIVNHAGVECFVIGDHMFCASAVRFMAARRSPATLVELPETSSSTARVVLVTIAEDGFASGVLAPRGGRR